MEYFNFTHSFHQYQTYPTNPSLHQYQSYPINPFLTSHTNPSFPSFPFETLASYSTDISFITPSQNLYYTHGYTPHLQPSCTSATTPNTHPNSTHIKHTFQQQTTNSLDSHSPFSQHITYHSHKATTTPQIKDLQDFLSETYEDDKMSIPIFDGKEDAYWWVLCAEKSFKDHRIPDTMKLQKAVTNLRGGAHQWWLWRSQHQPLLCWDTFTTVFLWHFKPEWRSILPIDEEEELALELQRSAELDDCLILSIEDEKEDLALELQRLMELDDCSILSIEDEKEERVLELHRLTENLIFPNSHYHELYSTFTPEMTTANSFSVLLKAPFNDIEFHGKVDFAIPPKPPDSKVTIKELPLPVKIRLPLRMLDFPGGKVEFTSEMRFISDTSNIRVHCYRILDDDGEFMNHTNPVQVNKKLAVRMHSEMVTFQGHHYQVTDIVSDDRDLVSSSSDCTLKWWRNDQCVQTWEAHKSTIQAVIKLPTRELVTGSSDTTLKIWKGKTCLHTFEEHSDTVPGLAGFSFDNSQIGRGRYELAAKVYEYVCGMMGPLGSTLFEELGLYYIGPVDGHNIEDLICVLQEVASLDSMGPVLVHVITDENQVGEHNKKSNTTDKQQDEYVSSDLFYNAGQPQTYGDCFVESLVAEAEKDKDIVVVHAGITSEPSLELFREKFPDRIFNMGVAEQHAVTFASGLSCGGLKPFCIIPSSFLQRAYDQVVHDVDQQKIPVRFVITSAGLVGSDGPVQCGAFDITFMSCLPNMIVMAPSDEVELVNMVATATRINDRPVCFRYPRGALVNKGHTIDDGVPIEIGKGRVLIEGKDVVLLGYGSMVRNCLNAHSLLANLGVEVTVADARFCKPLDIKLLRQLCKHHSFLVTVEEGSVGGFGSHVAQFIALDGLLDRRIKWRPIVLPDSYIEHASPNQQLDKAGLTGHHIAATALSLLGRTREALSFMCF